MGIAILIFLFGSIFLAILAFQDIPKYDRPYLFIIIISAIGILLGFLLWQNVKPIVWKNAIYQPDNPTASVIIIMSVIGILLFVANKINVISSQRTSCDTFSIIDKYRKEGGSRQPEVNTLVVNLKGKSETVVCDYDFWLNKKVGEQIELCFNKSLLGFNYIEIGKNSERL